MCVVGLVAAGWVELSGQSEEGSWVRLEVVHVKHGLRVGDLVLLQVVIQSCSWCPERTSNTFVKNEGKIGSQLVII